MKSEEKLIAMCLTGFIRKESIDEQKRCLVEIRLKYGKEIAGIINGYLKIC